MKVLHLHTGLLLGAGIERIIIDLTTYNKNVANYVCIINNKWDKENIEQINKNFLLLCNRKEGTKNPLINFFIVYKIYKYIQKNNIEIIHCHNAFSLKMAYLMKKLLKVKVIFTVHDTKVFSKKLTKYPIDKYIAISKSVYTSIQHYVPKEKIELVYNGVPLGKFANSRNSILTNKSYIISCVARIVPEVKGQDILIRALHILKTKYKIENFKCIFAGAITNYKTINNLKKLVSDLNLESHIEFLGNVNEVEGIYTKTDIFVLPSRNEGFGLVVIEALAAGCSVIVSKLEGPLEIVKENEEFGLYFEKENYNELATKIYKLIKDENYQLKYSKNDKLVSYIDNNFSLKQMIYKYNSIYREV